MASVRCRECGYEGTTDETVCPFCKSPLPKPARRPSRIRAVAGKATGMDWKSRTTVYGWPLVHVAFGRDETGRLRVAKGVIAIGQFAIGIVTVAQFGIGVVFGFGQFILGATAVAQFAGALLFGLGQFATGYVAIGMFAGGYYTLALAGFGRYVWSAQLKSPEAIEFFRNLAGMFGFSGG